MGAPLETLKRWFATIDPELLDENIVWEVPGYPVPKPKYVGRQEVFTQFFPELKKHFRTWGATPSRMIEDGDDVIVFGSYSGTTLAGKPIEVLFAHVWTVKEGKIAKVISIAETGSFSRALP